MFQTYVKGTGAYVPERVMTNFDLEKLVDTSDEWIRQRTGIRERRIAADHEATSDLSLNAARMALENSGVRAEDLDAIILCTVSPDAYCPASAALVQNALGAREAMAFDMNAACTGFVYGLTVATGMINSGIVKNALVIGAETLSRFMDFKDRNTCILFGDGAGAVVLARTEGDNAGTEDSASRMIDHYLRADGGGAELIAIPGGGSRYPASGVTLGKHLHYLTMSGKDVFRFATRSMIDLLHLAFERNGITAEDLDLVIPHQVNYRIIEAVLRKVTIPENRLYLNLDRYGNTSAASVPLALHEAVQEGRLKRGDLVLLVAFGAGLTWGYNLIRW